MPAIHVLVGHIASGKSTYALNAARDGFVIVNDDAIVQAVHAGDYTLYQKDLKLLYKNVEHAIAVTALAMGRSVIVDRGLNVSSSGRRRWTSLAASLDVDSFAIIFKRESPDVHAERRARADARGRDYEYWHKVAKYHDSVYENPVLAEGFTGVYAATWEDIQRGVVMLGRTVLPKEGVQ